jgi:hypothetical protein
VYGYIVENHLYRGEQSKSTTLESGSLLPKPSISKLMDSRKDEKESA